MNIKWEDLERDLKNNGKIREFLKERFGMYRTEIDREIEGIVKSIKESKLPNNLWLWENKTIPGIEKRNPARADLLKLILEKIRSRADKYGFLDEPVEDKKDEAKFQEISDQLSGIIGRVTITRNTPATPYDFYFWLKSDTDIHIEPGEFIEVNLADK